MIFMQPHDPGSAIPSEEELQAELIAALREPEEDYPWNPLDPEVESYFDALESQFDFVDALEDAFPQQAEKFFNHLQQQWSRVETFPCS